MAETTSTPTCGPRACRDWTFCFQFFQPAADAPETLPSTMDAPSGCLFYQPFGVTAP